MHTVLCGVICYFLWPHNCAAHISYQGSMLQGAQLPEKSPAVTPLICFPKAIPSKWLRPQLSHFHPMQVFSSRPYFLGVSHQSQAEISLILQCEVTPRNPSFILFLHRYQTCIILSSHKSPLTFYMCFFQSTLLYI